MSGDKEPAERFVESIRGLAMPPEVAKTLANCIEDEFGVDATTVRESSSYWEAQARPP